MKKTRYVIVDANMGIFLGTYSGEDLGMDNEKTYACFAANNPFKLTTACAFETEEIAEEFIENVFPLSRRCHLDILTVESESHFPTIVEIIKSGHAEHTFNMIEGMFDENHAIH